MDGLNYEVERMVEIQAPRETVFRYFTDSARWAKWWGAGSTIEPSAGGKVYIRHPNAVEVVGEVLDNRAPGSHRLYVGERYRQTHRAGRFARDYTSGTDWGLRYAATSHPRICRRGGARRACARLALSARAVCERGGR